MSENKQKEKKEATHILVERIPGKPDPDNPKHKKTPVVTGRTVGPLEFSFKGPGPWKIQEDHLRLVEDIVQPVKGKTSPPPPPSPPADTAGPGDNQAAGDNKPPGDDSAGSGADENKPGAKPGKEEKKETTGTTWKKGGNK